MNAKIADFGLALMLAYRSIMGSLRYLVHTRPDLAYSVGYVSRFMEEPTTEDLAAVKRVMR